MTHLGVSFGGSMCCLACVVQMCTMALARHALSPSHPNPIDGFFFFFLSLKSLFYDYFLLKPILLTITLFEVRRTYYINALSPFIKRKKCK